MSDSTTPLPPPPPPPPPQPTIKSPYPAAPQLPETNAHHIFFNRPEQAQWPDFTLHIDSVTGRKRGWKEFRERVRDGMCWLGGRLEDGGLGLGLEDAAGEKPIVGILSENSMDYLTLIHALLAISVPFTLISSYSTSFELKHALALSCATHLFVSPKLVPLALAALKDPQLRARASPVLSPRRLFLLQGHTPVAFTGSGPPNLKKNFGEMLELMGAKVRSGSVQRTEVRAARRETLAYLVFSSGTTGLPKAVMISHGNIIFSVAQYLVLAQVSLAVHTPPTPPTPEGIPIILSYLPLHHTYGLHAYAFRGLLAPSTQVIVPKWNIKTALALIPKHRITGLALIPSVIHQLVNYPGISKANFATILGMSSGAAYLPPDLAQKMSNLVPGGVVFTEGYGMSEATIAAIMQPYPGTMGNLKRVPGSVGVLLPGMEARIVRDDGTDVDVNEVGELWLRSRNICQGYWNNDKANHDTFVPSTDTDANHQQKSHWLKTGDAFRIDEEGYFFFADRTKDTLKVSGIQVSPVEIESVLLAHPARIVSDVSVAGVSGGRTADERVPRAWVVLSPEGLKMGVKEAVAELERWHHEQLSKYKWCRGGIEIVKEIPKSPTGKVLRRVLQDRYEQRMAKRYKTKL